MNNLKNLLKTPLLPERLPKWIPILLILIALIGFGDATFLTVKHYQNVIPPCTIGGCESVLNSSYSEILGIPVSLPGAIYYLIIAVSLFIFLDTKKEIFLRVPVFLSVFGLLASLWFSFLQAFVIKAFCPYCAVSALTSFTVFGFAVYIFIKFRVNLIK